MEVRSTGSVGGPRFVSATPSPQETAAPQTAGISSPQDQLEISSAGKLLDDISKVSGLREQRLAQIKQAIENNTYDTPEKLELALSRMLEQIQRDEPR